MWSYYLNSLPVLFEDVHSHHCFVELWIQRLDDFIVKMLLQIKTTAMKWHAFMTGTHTEFQTVSVCQAALPDTAGRQSL